MKTGSLKKLASPYLVMFVFGCVLIIIGLLYIMQSAEARADNILSKSNWREYLN